MRYLVLIISTLALTGCAGGYMYVESDIPAIASYGNDLQFRVAESVKCSNTRASRINARATLTGTNRTANRERYELMVRCRGLMVK